VPALTVLEDSFSDDPAFDVAVSRAVMFRVARGELPETLRIARPAAVIAFAKRDAVAPGYEPAVRAAEGQGFGAVLRLAGGRAAVFHEGTMEVAHAAPDADPRPGIHQRFRAEAGVVCRALERVGVDARVGEVAGEYCPGRWSVNAAGRRKLAGIGQRVVASGSHTGTVIVVEGAERIRRALAPVYAALSLGWDPETVGAVEEEAPGADWDMVRGALLDEYGSHYDIVHGSLDEATLVLARELAPEHRPPEKALEV
jgi:octanoyl-[GcvH]:protein N-octanoyltransferase